MCACVVRWAMCRKEKKKKMNHKRIDTHLIPKAVKKSKSNDEGWTGRDERDKGGAHGWRTRKETRAQDAPQKMWPFFGVGLCFVWR